MTTISAFFEAIGIEPSYTAFMAVVGATSRYLKKILAATGEVQSDYDA